MKWKRAEAVSRALRTILNFKFNGQTPRKKRNLLHNLLNILYLINIIIENLEELKKTEKSFYGT